MVRALAIEWTELGFMGTAVTSMIRISLAIDIGSSPEGVSNEKTEKATYVIPGPGQTAASTHPTSDHCTGPLLNQRNIAHSRSCPKLLPCRKICLSTNEISRSPEPYQTPQNLIPSTKFIKMFPGKLSRVRLYSQILGVGSLEANPERKKFAAATPLGTV